MRRNSSLTNSRQDLAGRQRQTQLDRDTWEAYARDQQDRANALAEKNTKLREALKAEQTRMLDLERELILRRRWPGPGKCRCSSGGATARRRPGRHATRTRSPNC